jgi:hypothetical protein
MLPGQARLTPGPDILDKGNLRAKIPWVVNATATGPTAESPQITAEIIEFINPRNATVKIRGSDFEAIED